MSLEPANHYIHVTLILTLKGKLSSPYHTPVVLTLYNAPVRPEGLVRK